MRLKLADLDAQLNIVSNIHTLKADMSIPAEKLPLPPREVRKKPPRRCYDGFSKKKVSTFSVPTVLDPKYSSQAIGFVQSQSVSLLNTKIPSNS